MLILSSYFRLGLLVFIIHQSFGGTNILYAFLVSPMRTICPAHLVTYDLIKKIISDKSELKITEMV
jgi:hypothetical protein